ncbi:MAG: hypothetical protein M3220_03855 [Chloroflexota bacterium]|nr:hypothetical protein [Chloroflexota bacterium]
MQIQSISRRHSYRILPILGMATLLLLIFWTMVSPTRASDEVEVGYRDFEYEEPCSDNPTAEKPESKLWWTDGSWWGSLCDEGTYYIHRLDLKTQSWENTGVELDSRATSRADTLWDEATQKLYLVSHKVAEGGVVSKDDGDWGRFYRYSYDASTDTYLVDNLGAVAGKEFAYVNNAETETLTLAKDSTGQLWVTYTLNNAVYVNRTLCDPTCNDGAWGEPFVLPIDNSATDLAIDDISAVVAYDGHIGIMWSNQNAESFFFAAHPDDAADTEGWEVIAAYGGSTSPEDHINLKSLHRDPAGNLFAVVKTSTAPEIVALLVCESGSDCTSSDSWTQHVVYRKQGDTDPTRPILLLDQTNRNVYVFVTIPEAGGSIYYKVSSIDNINFGDPTTKGVPFIQSTLDPLTNNPTSTNQTLTSETGLVVLASDSTTRYYLHNFLCLDPTFAQCPESAIPDLQPHAFLPILVNR